VSWFSRPEDAPPAPQAPDRVRAIEVPVLTELKRRLGHDDLAGALLYVYPKVVEDLARAYGADVPAGYSHEEIVARKLAGPMGTQVEFLDRLYRMYAPVRYGQGPSPGTGDEILEIVQSLYAPEPMWRLYLTDVRATSPSNGHGEAGADAAPGPE
jgi:hypothetical protein